MVGDVLVGGLVVGWGEWMGRKAGRTGLPGLTSQGRLTAEPLPDTEEYVRICQIVYRLHRPSMAAHRFLKALAAESTAENL